MYEQYTIPEFLNTAPAVEFSTCCYLPITTNENTADALCAVPERIQRINNLPEVSKKSENVYITSLEHPITTFLKKHSLMPNNDMSKDEIQELSAKINTFIQQNTDTSGAGYIVERFSQLLNQDIGQLTVYEQCNQVISTISRHKFLLVGIDEMLAESLFLIAYLCGRTQIPLIRKKHQTQVLDLLPETQLINLSKHLIPSILIYDAICKNLTSLFHSIFSRYPTLNLTFIKYQRAQLSKGEQSCREFTKKKILKKNPNAVPFHIPEFDNITPTNQCHTQVYVHIPKTGGHSVLQTFIEVLGPEHIFHPAGGGFYTGKNEFRALSKEDKHKIRFISGHNNFGIHKELDDTTSYFTIIRNPVECFISTYYFCWQTAVTRNYITRQIEFGSLEQWVNYNLQQNYRFGYLPETLMQFDPCWQNPQNTVNLHNLDKETVYNKTKKSMDTYFFMIGITEMMPESMFMLAWYNGWNKIPVIGHINKTKLRENQNSLHPLLIKKIKAVQDVSIQLYNEYKQAFEKKFAELCKQFPGLEESLKRYKQQIPQ